MIILQVPLRIFSQRIIAQVNVSVDICKSFMVAGEVVIGIGDQLFFLFVHVALLPMKHN